MGKYSIGKWLSLISLFLLSPVLLPAQTETKNDIKENLSEQTETKRDSIEYIAESGGHKGKAYWVKDENSISFYGKIGGGWGPWRQEEKFSLKSIDNKFIIGRNGESDTLYVGPKCSDLLKIVENEKQVPKGLQKKESEYWMITPEGEMPVRARTSYKNERIITEFESKEDVSLFASLGNLNKIKIYISQNPYKITNIILKKYNEEKGMEEIAAKFYLPPKESK